MGKYRCDDFDEMMTCDECDGTGVVEICDECFELMETGELWGMNRWDDNA